MDPAAAFRVTYWGVTGSYPRPQPAGELASSLARLLGSAIEHHGKAAISAALGDPAELERLFAAREGQSPCFFGGDTTCIQITAGDQLFIVDAGTGLRLLSQQLASTTGLRGNVFLTHAHFDHLCALPFFEPFYDPTARFLVRGAQRVLAAMERIGHPSSDLSGTFLPQTVDQMPGLMGCAAIEAGESLRCGDVTVTTFALTHPGGSLAYRFERAGKSIVIATDHEQPETPDLTLAKFALGADLLYMDAQYLQREYTGETGIGDDAPQARIGWGHTPIEACLPTAIAAGVKRLDLGHHEPRRSDAMLRDLDAYASRLPTAGGSLRVGLAYQGLTVDV
ncbi:MAG: MBL fold metallo-hydrolase [Planctomycetia bacterium]|nr:MBL fold metallo-hydrolase [Planctomycetia bacterium]